MGSNYINFYAYLRLRLPDVGTNPGPGGLLLLSAGYSLVMFKDSPGLE